MQIRDERRPRPGGDGRGLLENVAMSSGDGAQNTARDPFTQPDRLLAEWLATPCLLKRQRRELEEFGVTREAIHRAGGLGWARVSTAGRLFMSSDAGDVALIQPVWGGPAPSIYQGVEDPMLADLIAWRPQEPTRWAYRYGDCQAILGADNLEIAHTEGWPITFELTPLDWLRANCHGAVLLEICESRWRDEDEADAADATAKWWGGEAA